MDWPVFQIGDLVTRDGTDIHRVVDLIDDDGQCIEVECVKEPRGFHREDGKRGEPWTRLGDREVNLARRYQKIENPSQ